MNEKKCKYHKKCGGMVKDVNPRTKLMYLTCLGCRQAKNDRTVKSPKYMPKAEKDSPGAMCTPPGLWPPHEHLSDIGREFLTRKLR